MNFKVGLTYNLKRQTSADEGLPEDFFAEFDDEETVNAIAEALENGGCKVTLIEVDEKTYSKLMRLNPHIVFNMAHAGTATDGTCITGLDSFTGQTKKLDLGTFFFCFG
jgi:hypothetical protein